MQRGEGVVDLQKELAKINEQKGFNPARLDVPMIVKQKQMNISLLVLELTERMLTNPIVLGQMIANPVALAQVLREASKIGNLPLVKPDTKSIIDVQQQGDDDDKTNRPKSFGFQPAAYLVQDGKFVENPASTQGVDTVDKSVGNVDNSAPPIVQPDPNALQHKPHSEQYPIELAGSFEAVQAKQIMDDLLPQANAIATSIIEEAEKKKNRRG